MFQFQWIVTSQHLPTINAHHNMLRCVI